VLTGSFGGVRNTVTAVAVNLIRPWDLDVVGTLGLSPGFGWVAPGVWSRWTLATLAKGSVLALRFRRGRWKHIDVQPLGDSSPSVRPLSVTGLSHEPTTMVAKLFLIGRPEG
jgi:hypothetical protein